MGLTRPRFEQINSIITTISDPITVLNQGATLANIDVGFIINRNGGALANTAIFWNESANTFVTAFTTASGGTNANISISTYANLQVNTLNTTFVNATGNIIAGGNVTAGYFIGSGQFLTGLSTAYSNVNVKAYTESMGFQNYGNVNLIAYLAGGITSTGFINTSGNVSAAQINSATAVVTGSTYVGELFVTTRAADEGGQIQLATAVTNTTLSGNITIDVYQNRLRIWESGGTNRGGYFDISTLSASVGTNLAGGGGGTPGGGNGQLQFNSGGTFAGASSLYYFGANGAIVANAGIASTSTTTGTFQVTGGIGVSGNVYVGQRVGFVWGANNVSSVYQVFNNSTNSLDTVFG